ncbi:hypothetical protein F0919_03100 [Taibaiella lutea]|uniref:Uncharacterized protein n=1 Tax=Taibaiella lutea TaxID=2608001 RepID=A0A5M6CNQ5_9BACT|nr:hypothetical protein [Taibaiella lutea]KAA5536673.1 hypothetical protein F0919_03100 [Taibaiella lutea]
MILKENQQKLQIIIGMHNFAPMNRKNILFAAGAGLLLLASCQGGNNPNIAGKWQATSIVAPTQDSMMQSQMKMQMDQIDALTTVDSGMINRFHTSDLETVKKMAKEEVAKQPEQMKQQMKEAAAEFSFELMKDGKAVTFSRGGSDTASWYLGDNGKKLFLDPFESKSTNPMGAQNVMIFDIIHAGSDSLRLRVHQPVGNDVFVDLRPAKDSDKKTEAKK